MDGDISTESEAMSLAGIKRDKETDKEIIARYASLLWVCREQFDFYAKSHYDKECRAAHIGDVRAKVEARQKRYVNEALAKLIEEELS